MLSNPMWASPFSRELQMTTPQPRMQQSNMTPSPTYSDDWSGLSSFNSSSDNLPSPNYILGGYLPDPNITMGSFTVHSRASSHSHLSPGGSDQALSPLYSVSGLPSPSSPGNSAQNLLRSDSPNFNNMSQLDPQGSPENANSVCKTQNNASSLTQSDHQLYNYRQQGHLFREALGLPMPNAGPFLPQQMYKPHTTSDRKRYVEEVMLEAPLYFITEHPQQYGVLLKDVLHSRTKRLVNREQVVFEGRGPSVSIRLEWPGYRQWSRQIPTKDFRSPPQPITLAKLAKNVAKCVQRFMQEAKSLPMDEDTSDPRWRIGNGSYDIKFEDLVLVSIHHVSLGSWQPQLRLAHPLRPRPQQLQQPQQHQQQHQQVHYLPPTPRTASNPSNPSLLFPQLSNL
ncbi:hypothetical protein M413DRAFT_355641 [Hebeloma cylindrosporum]|uniref:Uncharacterized protein n=1 Tax=Hebeloma cylindrosporum TaxID=76867 RepID=A0A0C3C6M6_HEBCY|nr:hypothetical protein M413DRAFT_355641 [Hebeloma cylindrosporum h7]